MRAIHMMSFAIKTSVTDVYSLQDVLFVPDMEYTGFVHVHYHEDRGGEMTVVADDLGFIRRNMTKDLVCDNEIIFIDNACTVKKRISQIFWIRSRISN